MREAGSGSETNYTHIFVSGVEGFFFTKHKYMSPALYNNHIYLTAAGKGLKPHRDDVFITSTQKFIKKMQSIYEC